MLTTKKLMIKLFLHPKNIKLKYFCDCKNISISAVINNNLNQKSTTDQKLTNNQNFNNWEQELHSTMKVYENFISEKEENSLLSEVLPYVEKLRYEFDHWDNMIHGYRETEFAKWNEENTKIIDKVRQIAFPPNMPQLKLVHVLDLAEEGYIKPHVDSIRFCGDVIAGISLLSDSVMRLTYVGHEKEYWDDFYLPRRSLYIMKGVARQKYNHEILCKKDSIYKNKLVQKTRRISIICRSEPD